MMRNKSAAQIRRLEKRATERGEKYEPSYEVSNNIIEDDDNAPIEDDPAKYDDDDDDDGDDDGDDNNETPDLKITRQLVVATKLETELNRIDENKEMKSKDRRSAKRKAEAIATEESGLSAEELLVWYQNNKVQNNTEGDSKENRRRRDPLIAFVGQLSYETTKDDLFDHIHSHLGDDHKVTKEMIKIRMLTNAKTQKSRGMAFVEVINGDPDFLYALLTLHQTMLKGRRINIERSAGGKNNNRRKTKLDHYRKEQEKHFAEVVEKIFSEYRKTGELRENELDEGVILLCKHHAGPVVHAAVAEYIEKGGRDMNNPSAYLTFLVTKFAKEGIHDVEDTGRSKKKSNPTRKREYSSTRSIEDKDSKRTKQWKSTDEFAKAGVDMSISHETTDSMKPKDNKSENKSSKDLSTIFPSSQRGRGRGYMRNVRR